MKNIDMQVAGNVLTIKVDLSKTLGPSKSGKTTIIATTAGNTSIPGTDAKAELTFTGSPVGLCATIPVSSKTKGA